MPKHRKLFLNGLALIAPAVFCFFWWIRQNLTPSESNIETISTLTVANESPAAEVVKEATKVVKLEQIRTAQLKQTLTRFEQVFAARDSQEAAAAGLHALSAKELWDVAQRHPNMEVRRVGCQTSACSGYAN